ncbi:MAG: CapA family protein [Clostridium sp.]|jgi:poly-gamma-glutamate synthesis protein (capsule biosynthesis protein)|nr:CapA family protein [Clostridium sp.]
MGKKGRRQIFLAGFWVFAGLLSGCGDDVGVTVSPVKADSSDGLQEAFAADGAVWGVPGQESAPAQAVPEAVGKDNASEEIIPGTAGREEAVGLPADGVVAITISAAGDVSMGNYEGQDYAYSFRQSYDRERRPEYFLEHVRDIFEADDFTIVNLEGVLTFSEEAAEGRTYHIKGSPDYVSILTAGSVEGVSMGNNHRLDYGEAGSRDTGAALEKAGIVYAYDTTLGVYETKGLRIGFVSVNEASQGAGVEKFLKDGIEQLKEQGADLILACCHWGTEGAYQPEEYQTVLGRKCIDWGADLVIGHHPHVLQGVEEYHGKYIVYSLGNFCFGANRNPADKDTAIFQQTFLFRDGLPQEGGTARMVPCSISSVTRRNDFRPTPAQGEEARRILNRLRELSRNLGLSPGGDPGPDPDKDFHPASSQGSGADFGEDGTLLKSVPK